MKWSREREGMKGWREGKKGGKETRSRGKWVGRSPRGCEPTCAAPRAAERGEALSGAPRRARRALANGESGG
eukprot:1831838-Pleurochrysis_carterae.AAC.2